MTDATLYRRDILCRYVGPGDPRAALGADLHGYEIRRQLRENLGLLANVSFGSIYPALTRLEKAGAVVAAEGGTGGSGGGRSCSSAADRLPQRRAGRAAGASPLPHPARRGRKVYRITDAGRAAVRRAARPGAARPTTPGASVSASPSPAISPRQARLALLERRRAQLVQRLAEADEARADLDVYARSVVQHTADGVAHDISWLDNLIASERAAVVAAGSEPRP